MKDTYAAYEEFGQFDRWVRLLSMAFGVFAGWNDYMGLRGLHI
jgi:hypothetical protein